jgi:hypothetical protein
VPFAVIVIGIFAVQVASGTLSADIGQYWEGWSGAGVRTAMGLILRDRIGGSVLGSRRCDVAEARIYEGPLGRRDCFAESSRNRYGVHRQRRILLHRMEPTCLTSWLGAVLVGLVP